MRLQGKAAIVTGAASGFGEGIARRFAAEGAWVIVADLNLDGARRVAEETGGIAIGGDVSREGRRAGAGRKGRRRVRRH
jgi:3-oxoacyl-[acyl-carrier protein] reductase